MDQFPPGQVRSGAIDLPRIRPDSPRRTPPPSETSCAAPRSPERSCSRSCSPHRFRVLRPSLQPGMADRVEPGEPAPRLPDGTRGRRQQRWLRRRADRRRRVDLAPPTRRCGSISNSDGTEPDAGVDEEGSGLPFRASRGSATSTSTALPTSRSPARVLLSGGFAVYYGRSWGIDTVSITVISGNRGFFGASIAGAGDVNHDGYDDVVVGTPGMSYTSGSCTGEQPRRGRGLLRRAARAAEHRLDVH